MKVLAIDPGYDRLGVAVIERRDGKDFLLFSTCLNSNKKEVLSKRITSLALELENIFVEYEPDILGIETLFFNKNIKTAMGVAHMRGVILYLAERKDCEIMEFGPQEIKVAMTGYGSSDKAAVISMVQRLVENAPAKALDDEYDAIAVGVTALAHKR